MTAVSMIRGLPVSARSLAETIDLLTSWIEERGPSRFFACVNAHSAETAHRDQAFMAALQAAGILVADGYGVILASRLLGRPILERSTGPDCSRTVIKTCVSGYGPFHAASTRSVYCTGCGCVEPPSRQWAKNR